MVAIPSGGSGIVQSCSSLKKKGSQIKRVGTRDITVIIASIPIRDLIVKIVYLIEPNYKGGQAGLVQLFYVRLLTI